jgi:uncharacterized membrane protein YoaK (UPF0700 family)
MSFFLIARLLAPRPSWQLLPAAMGMEVVLIVTAYLAFASHATAGKEMFVVCFSLALGLQNGAFRRTGGISVHTTHLTGMVTGLIASEAGKRAHHIASRASTMPDPKSGLLYGIWGTFLLGAATGTEKRAFEQRLSHAPGGSRKSSKVKHFLTHFHICCVRPQLKSGI